MIQYNHLAGLFTYPDSGYPQKVRQTQVFLDAYYPEAGAALKEFAEFASQATVAVLEELYTRSFDVQAITTLDMSYVLFGDDYKRGALLVNLNREHRKAGIDCQSELADHLPNVLHLLAKMNDAELRAELAQKIVAPALRKVISEFDPEKIQQKNAIYKKHHKTLIERSERYGAIYQYPLKALYAVLNADFAIQEIAAPPQSADFLKAVGSEMILESQKF